MSTTTTRWSRARSSSNEPHTRPVWVKPWAITTRGPRPRTSKWSDGGGGGMVVIGGPDERTERGPPPPVMPTCRRRSRPRWWTSGCGAGCPTPWCVRDRGPHRWPWPWPAIRAWPSTSAWTSVRPGSPPSGWDWPPGDPPWSSPPAARRPPSSTPRWWRRIWPGCRCSSAPPTGHPSGATWGHPRPSTSSTSSGARPVGSPTPVSPTAPAAGRGGRWPPGWWPSHARVRPARVPSTSTCPSGSRCWATRRPGAACRPAGATAPPGTPSWRGDPDPDDAWVRSRVAGGVLRPGGRGLVLAGAGCGRPEAVSDMAAALGWPILADPRSGLRRTGPGIVGAADGILRSDRFADAHLPDTIVRLGEPWVSKVVNGFVSRAVGGGAHCVVVDPHGRWPDPDREVAEFVRADPGRFAEAVTRRLTADRSSGAATPTRWSAAWQAAEERARAVVAGLLGPAGPDAPITEPSLAHRLFRPCPRRPPWWCRPRCPSATSRPTASPGPGRPGSSPTGGPTASTAWCRRPSAWPWPDGPTVALVGDLAFLHDAIGAGGGRGGGHGPHRGGGRQPRGWDLLVPPGGRGARSRDVRVAVRHPAGSRSGRGGRRASVGRWTTWARTLGPAGWSQPWSEGSGPAPGR